MAWPGLLIGVAAGIFGGVAGLGGGVELVTTGVRYALTSRAAR